MYIINMAQIKNMLCIRSPTIQFALPSAEPLESIPYLNPFKFHFNLTVFYSVASFKKGFLAKIVYIFLQPMCYTFSPSPWRIKSQNNDQSVFEKLSYQP
jgi:hypothetical protein